MIFQCLPTQVIQIIVALFPASIAGLLVAITMMSAVSVADEPETHRGDVTDVRVVRRLEQHPYAGKVWQPFIIQGDKKKDLVVAFGAELNGKSDMGDILVSLSNDDGDSWSEPVHVFDHRQRQGCDSVCVCESRPLSSPRSGSDLVLCHALSHRAKEQRGIPPRRRV